MVEMMDCYCKIKSKEYKIRYDDINKYPLVFCKSELDLCDLFQVLLLMFQNGVTGIPSYFPVQEIASDVMSSTCKASEHSFCDRIT